MRKRSHSDEENDGRAGRIAAAIGRNPREFVGIVMATAATLTIFVNALFLQKGPHPAPIFASRPLLKQTVPLAPPRPAQAAGQRTAVEPPRGGNDPIAELLAPSKRVLAIQRALAEFGYGQIRPTGVYDPEMRAAIEKFERDHRLPVTGQISDRFVRELSVMTGRPLE